MDGFWFPLTLIFELLDVAFLLAAEAVFAEVVVFEIGTSQTLSRTYMIQPYTFEDRNIWCSSYSSCNQHIPSHIFNMSIAIHAGHSKYGFTCAFSFRNGEHDGLGIITARISVYDDVLAVGELELTFRNLCSDLHADYELNYLYGLVMVDLSDR